MCVSIRATSAVATDPRSLDFTSSEACVEFILREGHTTARAAQTVDARMTSAMRTNGSRGGGGVASGQCVPKCDQTYQSRSP